MAEAATKKQSIRVFVEESAAVRMLTASGLVVKGPVRLESITITAGGGNASIDIYDNIDDSGNEKLYLETVSNNSSQFHYFGKVKFERGIYVAFSANMSHATVVYWVDLPQ